MKNTFHLSPDGNDKNNGTTAKPWATLAGARDAIRELRSNGKLEGETKVLVQPGVYRLGSHVEFGPEDSHTTYCAASKDKPAVIDGAVELEGFREETVGGRRSWILDLPEAASGKLYFRSLFVNGNRRPRARFPKFSPDSQGVKNLFRISELRYPEKRKLFDGDNIFKPATEDFKDWASLHDAEIVILHYWIETRLGTPTFNSKTGWVTCARRSVFNLYEAFVPKLARYYIDNLKEALTDPGEWYLDRSEGRLTYLPMPGEKLGKTKICFPKLNSFIRITGAAYNHYEDPKDPFGVRHVENLRFEGLTFRNSDWFPPMAEFLAHDRVRVEGVPLGSSPQGAVHVPGAIELRWARNCAIDSCVIEHVGLTAVAVEAGCRNCAITNSTLRDIGGGGVKVGGSELDGSPADRTGHITVADNSITDIGKIFQQGIGILLTNAFSCHVAHNEIARTCYTAISCGWSWSYRDTVSRDNIIENNYIHDIGQGVLSDMGGIYLLGVQPGTTIRGNHIHGISSAEYGGWGVYPDQASSHLLIEGNWVHDIQGSALRIHYGREMVVRDNVFARIRGEGVVGIGKVDENIAANLSNNVLLGPATCVFDGGYAGDVRFAFRSDANLVWFPDGKIPTATCYLETRTDMPRTVSWEEWLAFGNDRRTIIADPLIRETAKDLVFPKNSPVFQIGFRPRSWAKCGPRKPAGAK